jgi:hypothetical protein
MPTVHPLVPWITLLIALLSLGVSTYTAWRTFRRNMYQALDNALTDLVRICLQHPELRNPDHCKDAYFSADPAVKYKYDAYAVLVWNYLESLYLAYGDKLKDGVFYGPLRDLGERHKAWYFADNNFKKFDTTLIKFLGVER